VFEPCPLWKKANKEARRKKAREIGSVPCNFSFISEIDFLISWIKGVIAEHVPLSKLAPFCAPWWSEEIGKLVEEARRAFRKYRRNLTEVATQEYLLAHKTKVAAISKATRRCFEEAIETASKEAGKSFLRLAKWAKSKSFLPPSLLFMSTLTTLKGLPLHLKPDVRPSGLTSFYLPLLLIFWIYLIFNLLLINSLPPLIPLTKLLMPYLKHTPIKP
jgi:hypothetical protein